MKKERQEKEKTEAEAQAYLREAAIKSLEAKGLLEDLKVYNGDTHDAMTPERQEKLIEEEMKKLAEPSKQSKEEIALQALKKLGYISPKKTINDLKPYERDALLAQMRITNEETSNKKR
jgi:20S proteasome alpha/beta subunit